MIFAYFPWSFLPSHQIPPRPHRQKKEVNPLLNILVSACLLGHPCRYDGTARLHPSMEILSQGRDILIPFCPEVAAGLPVPRLRAECRGDLVLTEALEDVTSLFELGAHKALELAMEYACPIAILKERSPSCGCGMIYDGNFQANLIPGMGVTARRLVQAGIFVLGESNLEGHFNRNNPKFSNKVIKANETVGRLV